MEKVAYCTQWSIDCHNWCCAKRHTAKAISGLIHQAIHNNPPITAQILGIGQSVSMSFSYGLIVCEDWGFIGVETGVSSSQRYECHNLKMCFSWYKCNLYSSAKWNWSPKYSLAVPMRWILNWYFKIWNISLRSVRYLAIIRTSST